MIVNRKWKNFTVEFDYSNSMDIWYIDEFEKKNNICLPKTYKELMVEHNGAGLKEDHFDFINLSGEEDERSFLFKAFGEKERGKELIEDAQFVSDPTNYGIPGLIGFGSTGEGDTLCFDYRDDLKTCEPKIILLVHDEYDELPDGSTHMHIEPIANSFDAFLDKLYEYKEEDIEWE